MLFPLILSLSLNLALTGLTLFSYKVLDRKNREQVRERQAHAATTKELLDRLMYVTNKPWVPTPRETAQAVEEELDEDTQLALAGWTEV